MGDESGNNWDGMGLGLPICKQLLSNVGGKIFYKSVEKVYTKFVLVIPANITSYNPSLFSKKPRLSKLSNKSRNSNSNVNDTTNINDINLSNLIIP